MTKMLLFGIAATIMMMVIPVGPAYAETVRIETGSYNSECKETNECFIPHNIKISKGASITWMNGDSVAHTITSGSVQGGHDGVFDSGKIEPGETFSHVFNKTTDTFRYFCTIYPWMNGSITINEITNARDKGMEKEEEAGTEISNIENKTEVIPTKFVMNVDDRKIASNYNITEGSNILDIYPEPESNALVVKMNATEQGTLSINLPREVIDAKIGNTDDYFYVLVDEEEMDFDEIATPTNRTISVWFSENTDEIEIIGTFVIPEFGTIAMMILTVAIISIVAISAKSKLSFFQSK